MLMPFYEEESEKLERVERKLGEVELLGQCSEECAELIQAAQKMRRVLCKTTPVGRTEALENLKEEAADVIVCLEALITSGLLPSLFTQKMVLSFPIRNFTPVPMPSILQTFGSATSASRPNHHSGLSLISPCGQFSASQFTAPHLSQNVR